MLRTLRRLPLLLAIWGSPILPAHEIVISEIQYHPHGNLPEDEFLEIENRGTAGVDLSGWFFSAGVRLAFPSGTSIEPGEALVISPDAASTAARYGIEASRVIGGLEGRLDNDGEVIALCDASGHQVTRVHYRDRGGWPEEADGLGPSLELLPGFWDPDLPESWRSSRRVRGTPGEPTVLEEEGPSSRAAVPAASEWRYFEGESEPAPGDPLAWTRIGFDDSSWPRGQQPIGFGSAEVRTEIAAMWGGFLSLYMRCDFDLTSAEVDLIESGLAEISLAVRYDDGFVAYVNGTEVLRQNVGGSPGEPVPFDAQALEPQDGTRASILPASGLLRAGANTVALQGVNRSLFSGDFILGATVQLSIAALVGDSPIALRINEVRPSAGPGPGFIEIHNPGRQRRSLAGYRLTDSPYRDDPFVFPAGAAVDAGGWLSVRASELGFDLPQETRVYLLVDPEGNLADAFESAPALPEHSSVRHPDGSGRTYSTPTPTEGAANEFQPDERLVVSEIHYHPADDPAGDLEFIEIVNRSGAPVSLRGWRLSEAVDFSFPDDASIAPLEFLVVARNPEAMRSRYGLSRVLGPFEGRLANDEERIQLRDAFDNVVSRVHYADDGAWPTAADGEGPSLELVNADLDNEYAAVWRAGPPGGTPGVGNASYRAEVAPIAVDVAHEPPIPSAGESVTVTCRVLDTTAPAEVQLLWSNDTLGGDGAALMVDGGSDGDERAGDGVYTAVIPPQAEGSTIRFEIVARDATSSGTAPGGGRYFLYEVNSAPVVHPGFLHYTILMTRSNWQEIRRRSAGSDVYLDGTFVDHQSGEVIYNVGIRYRGNGSRNPPDDRHNYRVRFGDDRKFNGLKRLNFNSQNVQRQHLGNDAFRRAGVPCSVTVPAVLRFDQTTDALYVRLEAYDEDFLDRVFGGDDEGNLYRGMNGRLDYRGEDPGDYDGNYRKVTNEEENDFSDLIALTRAFSTADEEEFAAEVSARIDVYEWILYFAANSALGNNENSILLDAGDDYYLYSRPSDGRFLILPWDCDSLLVDAQQALFRPSAAAIARLLRHPLYAPYYYCELDRLHADVVSPEAIYPRLARAAALYTDDQVQGVEDFVWNRGDYLDARIPRSIEVDPHRTSRLTLVAAGDEWSYWKGTSHPSGGDLSWTEIGFDDSEWPVGPSGFGYGDGDDATLLDDMQGSYSTVFIRRRFAAGDVSGVLALFLSVDYDDGFVAYLNGAEIARSNYNPEIPDHNDTAARDHEAGTAQEFAVADGPQILHEGENVLAIVAFNGSLDSSDVSIIPALEATLSGEDLGCGECAQQTTQSRFELSGRAPGCATYTVLVNGVEARYVPWQAAWDITVDLLPGENRFEIEALDLALNTTDFRAVTIHRGGTVQPLPSSITGILRLTPDEGPYRLSGDVLVEAGGELRIEAGARVYLEPSAHLRVEGSFSARGTEELAVRISAADCASGGGAITIDGAAGASSALFEHCEITGGGVSGGGRIRVIDGAAEIRDCLFRDILGFAVEAVRSEVRVERTIIAASAGGLLASASRLAVGSVDLVDTAEGIRADGGEVRIDGARVKGAATGVRLAGGSHRLSRLLVHASTLGLDILAGTGLAADHLTIAGNRTGVQNASTPGTGADEVSIDSSIIWANRTGRAGAGQAAFSYCDVQDGSPAGEGNISFDPSFADASRGDYRLLPGSPARGSGRDGSDMGAYAASESPPQFIRGDADDGGQVNLTDSVFTLMWLFQGGLEPPCLDAADSNDDGMVNLSDAVRTLAHLFQGAPSLPPPFPDPGIDPTEDGLGCRS